jgi:antitoxin component HigA of HigAB toxin-antitoxin module
MTLQVRIIRTHDEYEAALARLTVLMRTDLASGSTAEDEFELLRRVVADFEGKHQQPCPVQPLDAMAFRMERQRLNRSTTARSSRSRRRPSVGCLVGGKLIAKELREDAENLVAAVGRWWTMLF